MKPAETERSRSRPWNLNQIMLAEGIDHDIPVTIRATIACQALLRQGSFLFTAWRVIAHRPGIGQSAPEIQRRVPCQTPV